MSKLFVEYFILIRDLCSPHWCVENKKLAVNIRIYRDTDKHTWTNTHAHTQRVWSQIGAVETVALRSWSILLLWHHSAFLHSHSFPLPQAHSPHTDNLSWFVLQPVSMPTELCYLFRANRYFYLWSVIYRPASSAHTHLTQSAVKKFEPPSEC